MCSLAQQIGRPDLALSLIVLTIALPPTSRLDASNSSSNQKSSTISSVIQNLASSVTYLSLVRRLGRLLASVLPRLVPRIYVRRFDYERPKLRQAMENVWHGLVLYSTNLTVPSVSSGTGDLSSNLIFNNNVPSSCATNVTLDNSGVSNDGSQHGQNHLFGLTFGGNSSMQSLVFDIVCI